MTLEHDPRESFELIEASFLHFVEATEDLVTVVDPEGRLLFVNRAAEQVFGCPSAECLGTKAFDFVHPEDRADTEAAFRSWCESDPEEPLRWENRQIGRHGDVHDVVWTISRHLDDAGQVRSFFSIARDVTRARAAAEELRRSELRMNALLAGMMDPMVTIDQLGIVQRANRAVQRVFGYEPEELIGENIKVLMPEPHRSEHDAYLAKYRATGETWILDQTREFEVLRKDGSAFVCELSVSRIDVPGEKEPLFSGSFRDVTERQRVQSALAENERRFRAIFDQEFQFVGLLTPEGRVLECNRTALQVSGKPREEVLGQLFWDACWPGDERAQERIRRAVRTAAQGGFVRFEIETRGREGDVRSIDFSIKPILDANGRVVLILPEGRDITDLKRAQQRETSMLRTLASVGESAATLAHEIKNPITAVNAALRAVADQLGEDHRVVLEELAGKMQRLERLMRRTLSFVRPVELQLERCSLGPLVRAIAEDMRPGFEVQDTELNVIVEPNLPRVAIDTQLFEEVLVNLLVNAGEALGRGGHVEVRVGRSLGDQVCVDVEDDGPGVPANARGQLFQPFFTSKATGTGIGLALARKLVEQHGGELVYEPRRPSGARFSVRLPAAP